MSTRIAFTFCFRDGKPHSFHHSVRVYQGSELVHYSCAENKTVSSFKVNMALAIEEGYTKYHGWTHGDFETVIYEKVIED